VNSDAGTVTYINPFSLFLNPMTGAMPRKAHQLSFLSLPSFTETAKALFARSFHRFFTGVLKNSRRDGASCWGFRMFLENLLLSRICHAFSMSTARLKNPISGREGFMWRAARGARRCCP